VEVVAVVEHHPPQVRWLNPQPLHVVDGVAFYDRAVVRDCLTVSVDDTVLFAPDAAPESLADAAAFDLKLCKIGLITCLFETPDHDDDGGASSAATRKMMEVRRFYAPSETPEGRKPYHCDPEVLPSTISEEYALASVVAKCVVEHAQVYRMRSSFPRHVFMYSGNECIANEQHPLPFDGEDHATDGETPKLHLAYYSPRQKQVREALARESAPTEAQRRLLSSMRPFNPLDPMAASVDLELPSFSPTHSQQHDDEHHLLDSQSSSNHDDDRDAREQPGGGNDDEEDDDNQPVVSRRYTLRKRKRPQMVLDDDDDDDDDEDHKQPLQHSTTTPQNGHLQQQQQQQQQQLGTSQAPPSPTSPTRRSARIPFVIVNKKNLADRVRHAFGPSARLDNSHRQPLPSSTSPSESPPRSPSPPASVPPPPLEPENMSWIELAERGLKVVVAPPVAAEPQTIVLASPTKKRPASSRSPTGSNTPSWPIVRAKHSGGKVDVNKIISEMEQRHARVSPPVSPKSPCSSLSPAVGELDHQFHDGSSIRAASPTSKCSSTTTTTTIRASPVNVEEHAQEESDELAVVLVDAEPDEAELQLIQELSSPPELDATEHTRALLTSPRKRLHRLNSTIADLPTPSLPPTTVVTNRQGDESVSNATTTEHDDDDDEDDNNESSASLEPDDASASIEGLSSSHRAKAATTTTSSTSAPTTTRSPTKRAAPSTRPTNDTDKVAPSLISRLFAGGLPARRRTRSTYDMGDNFLADSDEEDEEEEHPLVHDDDDDDSEPQQSIEMTLESQEEEDDDDEDDSEPTQRVQLYDRRHSPTRYLSPLERSFAKAAELATSPTAAGLRSRKRKRQSRITDTFSPSASPTKRRRLSRGDANEQETPPPQADDASLELELAHEDDIERDSASPDDEHGGGHRTRAREQRTKSSHRRSRTESHHHDPAMALLPRRLAPKEAFVLYLQYLASACLDADFIFLIATESAESQFRQAIAQVQTAIMDRTNILMHSSLWKSEFKHALERYPRYHASDDMGVTAECQACRRHMRAATICVRLEGRAYDSRRLWHGEMNVCCSRPLWRARAEILARNKHTNHRERLLCSW